MNEEESVIESFYLRYILVVIMKMFWGELFTVADPVMFRMATFLKA